MKYMGCTNLQYFVIILYMPNHIESFGVNNMFIKCLVVVITKYMTSKAAGHRVRKVTTQHFNLGSKTNYNPINPDFNFNRLNDMLMKALLNLHYVRWWLRLCFNFIPWSWENQPIYFYLHLLVYNLDVDSRCSSCFINDINLKISVKL
jgi:hypothetical protein